MDLSTIYTDQDIIKLIDEVKPSVTVIDAPLSLPKGRCCLKKNCNALLEDISDRQKKIYANMDVFYH